MGAWKLSKRAQRRKDALEAKQFKNKPAEKETTPPVELPEGNVIHRDFPAGNLSDIKPHSLFLHSDGGKATKVWWGEAKGIAV